MSEEKDKGGRPRIEISDEMLGKVQGISTMQCPDEEIAAFLGMSYSTFKRRKAEDLRLTQAIETGRDQGRQMLRAAQWTKAIGDGDTVGNITMLIWLGKQYLGQSDKADLYSGGKPFEFTIAINGEKDQDQEVDEESAEKPGSSLVH